MAKHHIFLLFVWLGFTIIAFSYFINEKLIKFDPKNKLNNIEYSELSSLLSPYLSNSASANKNKMKHTVLHFSQPNCTCQQFSQEHVQNINKLASNNGFAIKNIIINNKSIIPSTPAVALLDEFGELIYFGPYGQGIACSQTSGYAQTILNNFIKGYNANIIIKEAKGCYCVAP